LTGINTFAPDIYEATLTSNGYNLIGNSTGSTGFGANDILNPAGGAKVGTLSSNGGPTQTAPLNAGSPAIDAGTPAGCTSLSSGTNPLFTNGAAIPTDQRYFGRSGTGNRCDIGAFEYQAVTLAAPTLSQTFNPTTVLVAQTSTLTFTLTNPAANPSKLDNIQFNAVLSGPGAFSGVLSGTCGLTAPASGTSLNTTGVSLNAAASCTIIVTVTSTGAGTVSSTVSSIFAAQTGNTALVGNVANLTVTAPATATTTVLSSSAAGNTSVVGQSVTFTATVSPTAGGGTPTGTVTFTITQGATTVTSQGKALSGGAASLSYAFATTGAYTVKASYGGDTNFAVSNATDLSHSVTSATTSTVLTSNAPSNTIPVGQNVTFTATVSAVGPGAGIPTGIVTFRLDGVDQTPTVVLDSAGKASFSTSSLAVGSHTLTASFGGGTNYQASNSSNLVLTVTAATVSLVVSVPGDDGSGSVIGTLSYALKQASSGSIISFNLPIGVSIIAVSGKLPSIPKGVSVQGICSAGKPQITIDGTGVSSTSDGLVLLGQVQLNGLKVKGFKGKQIVAQSQGNKLSCVVAQRS